MALLKNPFARDRADEQIAPDLTRADREKIETAMKEVGHELEQKQVETKEGLEQTAKEKLAEVESGSPNLAAGGASVAAPAKSINLLKIEQVMEDDLAEIFFNMDEAHRALFKAEGERAAREIDRIISAGKSVAVKILEVLKHWLRLIPGVNKFFIEQEAKIKTDKILKATEIKQ